ncbi:Uncharacterised protein [Actinobacillus pleuropneumoniae]|nr:Uncharacterised protein [Actinobacillus pleuropneumoniae]
MKKTVILLTSAALMFATAAGTISAKPSNTPPGKTSNAASPKGAKEKKPVMTSIKPRKSSPLISPAMKKTKLRNPQRRKQRMQPTLPPIKSIPRTMDTKDTKVC